MPDRQNGGLDLNRAEVMVYSKKKLTKPKYEENLIMK
jgi:hypothetical protein